MGEFVDVAENGFATPFIELGDPIFFDVLFAAEAEFPLDGQFDGQSVTVPPCLTRHEVPLHRAIAREDVFEDTGLHMVGSWSAVGRGRALVKGPQGAPPRLGQGSAQTPHPGPKDPEFGCSIAGRSICTGTALYMAPPVRTGRLVVSVGVPVTRDRETTPTIPARSGASARGEHPGGCGRAAEVGNRGDHDGGHKEGSLT